MRSSASAKTSGVATPSTSTPRITHSAPPNSSREYGRETSAQKRRVSRFDAFTSIAVADTANSAEAQAFTHDRRRRGGVGSQTWQQLSPTRLQRDRLAHERETTIVLARLDDA